MPVLSFTDVENIVINAVNQLKKNTKLIDGIDIDKLIKHAIAIAYQESKFDTEAKNKKSTASGLFQILVNTQKDIETRILKIPNANRSKIFDPDYSAYLAVAYLAYQIKRYKNDYKKAVIAYNLGSWNKQHQTAYSKKHFDIYASFFNKNTKISNNDFAYSRVEYR